MVKNSSIETDFEATARLVVVEGLNAGTIFPLLQRHVVIGRLSSSDLPLSDGTVSRLHARLFFWEGTFHIEDLGSRGGTKVNGARVENHTRLDPGDEIRIGAVLLRYQNKDGAQ